MDRGLNKKEFTGYEYKEVTVNEEQVSFFLDCYEHFGWIPDENVPVRNIGKQCTVKLKRDRKIINKMELTRLQRHFEACAGELTSLEKSRTTAALIWALAIGIIGTAFMAGSVFAVTAEPPAIVLCIILAVPGFLGWLLPYFVYRRLVASRSKKVDPFIEEKYDEIYEICKKGHSLL